MRLYVAKDLVYDRAIIRCEDDNSATILLHGTPTHDIEGALGIILAHSESRRLTEWLIKTNREVQDKIPSAE